MSAAQTLLHAFVRWTEFVALTTLVGGLVFPCLIVRPPFLLRQEFDRFERRCHSVRALSLLLLGLASLADLLLRSLVMSGRGMADLGAALPAVLHQTHYGVVWISRLGVLGLLGAAWLIRRRGAPGGAWSVRVSVLGATLVALTTTLSGHAADWGDVTLPVLIDWLHLLAISIWIGGLFILGFVLPTSVAPPGKGETVRGLASLAARFSRMAAWCTAVFLVTGWYNAWLQVASLSPLLSTSYGWTLLAKLSLLSLVLMIAAVNRYYFLPQLDHHPGARDRPLFRVFVRFAGKLATGKQHGDPGDMRHQFLKVVRLEWIVAVGMLACAALLTQLPPGRHIRRHEHREQHAVHQSARREITPQWALAASGSPLTAQSVMRTRFQ